MSVTIESWLKESQRLLSELSDSAALDSQLLMQYVLDCNRTYLFTWSDKLLSDQQQTQLAQLQQRRLAGEPIAHIIGEREFWSMPFKVSNATLIPRPDTETLVEAALNHIQQNPQQSGNGLDLGTGTGAIALALASETPNWQWTAVDKMEDAVKLAKINAENLGINNCQIIQSNWFSGVGDKKFDLIVTNPPYIDEEDPHLAQGDVVFEPLTALVAADNGLADIKEIIVKAKDYLITGGPLMIEHGYQQGEAVRALFLDNGYQNSITIKDLSGNERVSVGYLEYMS